VKTLLLAGTMLCAGVVAAAAQELALKTGVEECVQSNLNSGSPIAQCMEDAMSNCASLEAGSTDQLGCYLRAKDEWGERIKVLLDDLSDKTENFREIARIEARYSVSRNLMECGRQLELMIVGREATNSDQLDSTICESRAVGVSYIELLFASGRVTRP